MMSLRCKQGAQQMVNKILSDINKGITIWQRVEKLEEMVEKMQITIYKQRKCIDKQEKYIRGILNEGD